MKLYFSPASPYVRKVMVAAHEKGLADRIELLPSAASPINRDKTIVRSNPSGKVPTMLLDTGQALYDSRVICAYVDSLSSDPLLIPAAGETRFAAMTLEALAMPFWMRPFSPATKRSCVRRSCAGTIGRGARWRRSKADWIRSQASGWST